SRWRKGEVVRDDRVIPIPASTEPGPVAITVGVWDATRRKRLHVDGGAATTVRLELTRLRVAPGQS
ncbi:MAG TPA: hypothetical protein VJB36_12930, partial [Methylomirabilota bacterium]|nr:hypothetical protein [Methylomirabilota bacterium]